MSVQNGAGVIQQDRTLTDLLESYRHRQADDRIPDERKRRAAKRMKPVWAKLAKLQDPNGFINHLTAYIQEQYQRRHNHEDEPGLKRRAKPLCRCNRPKHVCEAKRGVTPSKIRTQNLQYVPTADPQDLAREYVQSHPGDVVVREAMKTFRELRAEIYAELSDILAMMMGADEPEDDGEDTPTDAPDAASEPSDPSPTAQPDATDATTAAADGGGNGAPVDDLHGVELETVSERGEDSE